MSDPTEAEKSLDAIMRLFDLEKPEVLKLKKDGVIPAPDARGIWHAPNCTLAYIRHLRARLGGGKLSETQLSILTGKARPTVRRKLASLPHTEGHHGSRLYDPQIALEAIYGVNGEEGFITAGEANRQLSISKTEQIKLDMEVTRKSRIPLEIVEAGNMEAVGNTSAMLKGYEGKVLTAALIGDILAEFRRIGEATREWRPLVKS